MAFNHKYNTDDVLLRAAIIGLVNELNNKISFENTWSDEKVELVRVPFFYSMAGDERFLQDAFSNWSDCYPDFLDGNTDPIPRGTLTMTGNSILSNNLTSRYVRGNYTKEVDGELKQYNSYINSIPVHLSFTAEIMVDSDIDSFKIIESAMAELYKTLVFSIKYKGFRIPTVAGFPESYASSKQFNFNYGTQDERTKVSFDIELETYLPIPEKTEEFFAGNKIKYFGVNIDAGKEQSNSIVKPVDVPNVSPNEQQYMFPESDAGVSSGQTNPQRGEGFMDRANYYSGQYWR